MTKPKNGAAKRARLSPDERAKREAGERLSDAASCLTVVEAAKHCGVHPETVKRWISSGTLLAFKLGGSWRIRPAQVDAFLKAQGAVV